MTNRLLILTEKKEDWRITDQVVWILRLTETSNLLRTVCKHLEKSIWTFQEVISNKSFFSHDRVIGFVEGQE